MGEVFNNSGVYFDVFCGVRNPECKTAHELFSVRGFGEYDENTVHALKEMSKISRCCFGEASCESQTTKPRSSGDENVTGN